MLGIRSLRTGPEWQNTEDPRAKNIVPRERLIRFVTGGLIARELIGQLRIPLRGDDERPDIPSMVPNARDPSAVVSTNVLAVGDGAKYLFPPPSSVRDLHGGDH